MRLILALIASKYISLVFKMRKNVPRMALLLSRLCAAKKHIASAD